MQIKSSYQRPYPLALPTIFRSMPKQAFSFLAFILLTLGSLISFHSFFTLQSDSDLPVTTMVSHGACSPSTLGLATSLDCLQLN